MPKFLVVKCHDAFVEYERVVEAATADEAHELAHSLKYEDGWKRSGHVPEYDFSEIFRDRIEELADGDGEPVGFIPLHVTLRQRDTILAALRLWQDTLIKSASLQDIACGEHDCPLDDQEIDELCVEINV